MWLRLGALCLVPMLLMGTITFSSGQTESGKSCETPNPLTGRELAEAEGWLAKKGSVDLDDVGYVRYDGTVLSSCNCSEWWDDGADYCCGDRSSADMACFRFVDPLCDRWEEEFFCKEHSGEC